MPHSSTPLFHDLSFRGLVKQVTAPELLTTTEPLTLYCGFDPTSDSLHVGSLLPLLALKRFQDAGHKVIALVGGATGMIGDPSGKSQERKLLDAETLKKNEAGISAVIARFLKLDGPNGAVIVNNYDWFQGLGFIEFLRDVGKHFTVNHMMAKESVRARLEDRDHGISYTEFSYMLLQAYDFYVLSQRYGCNLQIGGSDQWGNITAGIELIRRIQAHKLGRELKEEDRDTAFGMTMPLVSKSDGTKFGKSESGTIWLTEDKTSPYQLYQFFLQTSDADVSIYLRYFTFLSREEIHALEKLLASAPEKREAQTRLAQEMVKLVHGPEALEKALSATQALFGGSSSAGDLKSLSLEALLQSFEGAPTSEQPLSRIQSAPIPVIDLLVESGLCPSKGQARKDIQGGGIYLNNDRMEDVALGVTAENLLTQSLLILRKGKKNYHLIKFV